MSPVRDPLPIDPFLPRIADALAGRPNLVLVAEPGAGKTTRVPPLLASAPWAAAGEILVLEPRRLAARMAARRVAEELGEPVGATCGYQVRFDEKVSAATRIRFVTEAIVTRRLLSDPRLDGVAAVVLDEIHERSLDADLALALLRRLQRERRPELRLVAMSATLDAAPLARFLETEALDLPGRVFPVAIDHAATSRDERPLAERTAGAVRALFGDGDDGGDVLVFLPGAAEIRRTAEALAPFAAAREVDVVPLHGDLPAAEQDRAVRRGPRRKVILATNVAESSITVPGVTAVVDAGLARVAGHSPWSGLPTLATEPIARASAAQRAGRAGRTAPGRAVRLYTRADHDARPAHAAPEIARADLAGAMLALAAAGITDPAQLAWLDAPPAAAVGTARDLLERLGALAPDGTPSAFGRAMLRLPLHPRAAALALAAAARGAPRRGALLAALLGERDVLRERRASFGPAAAAAGRATGPSDLLERLDALAAWRDAGARPERAARCGLDAGAAAAVLAGAAQVERALGAARSVPAEGDDDAPLLMATLAAFPDRVARRRAPGAAEVVFADGGAAMLDRSSVVRGAAFLVAVDADERAAGNLVRSASAIEPEWLIDLFPARVVEFDEARFDREHERVLLRSGLAFGAITLSESVRSDGSGPAVEAALRAAAADAGPAVFAPADEIARWCARIEFARRFAPEIPPCGEAEVAAALGALCVGRRSFAELRAAGLLDALAAALDGSARAALERLAPERVGLPRGRRAKVEYAAGRAPWVESYLQDFFGAAEGPRIAGGAVAVQLHLLAPSRRPVQVTTDLASFWERHYPELRRQLMRRYPRHAWPDDPRAVPPPPPAKTR